MKIDPANMKLTEFIVKAGMATSLGDARRKIEQGGVSVNGDKIKDYNYILDKKDNRKVIKVGKLGFCKVVFK